MSKPRKIMALILMIILTIGILMICSVCILPKYDSFCAVYPYSCNNMNSLNQTLFEERIQIVKEIGFKGVKLWNVECYYDEDLLSWSLDVIRNESLQFIIPIQYFNRSRSFRFPSSAWERRGFIENDDELSLFCDYVKNVSEIAGSYTNFYGYIIYYPFNSSTPESKSYWTNQIPRLEYKNRLQQVIDNIRRVDINHPVWLGAEMWEPEPIPLWDLLPKDLNNVTGFAFQHYNTVEDDIQKEKLTESMEYWRNFSEDVNIAEFGYCTKGDPEHGKASSEQQKVKMITDFLDHICEWDVFACYFGLTDFPPENADFGIIYDNNTLKPSGKVFKDILHPSLLKNLMRRINGLFSTFSGSLCFFLPLSTIYFLYFWVARDEMKGRPKLKRIVWLYLIPASFPITFLIFLILIGWSGALIAAIMTSMILIVIFAAIGEVSSE